MTIHASRRSFIEGLFASAGLAGCQSLSTFTERPKLTFGVISDIHITTPASTAKFRKALRYFRAQGADAVMVAGDLSDWGLKSGLQYVKDAWNDEMGDTSTVPLFITGNHDYDGWWYGDMTLDMHVQGYSEKEALSYLGMQKCWEEVFREPFAEIRLRTVNGVKFVSVEWHGREKSENDLDAANWLEAHRNEFSDGKPFFFFRHSPLPGTVSSGSGRPGVTVLKEKLDTFPNCVAFTGHTHWTYNDERSIWQGGFTAISIPSMSYSTMPPGHVNGYDKRNTKTKCAMRILPARPEFKEAHGFFVKLYDTQMVVERHDFEIDRDSAEPWIVPLPLGGEKPYTFAAHAKVTPVPFFPSDATLQTNIINSERRNGTWSIFVNLVFPSARAENGGRVFDYEVRVVGADGKVLDSKLYLSPGFYKPLCCEPEEQQFRYDAMDLPERGRYRFEVYARNSFGACSAPLVSTYRESVPGKDRPQDPSKGNK